jgi:DNA-binding MarR family transcriptional regulator
VPNEKSVHAKALDAFRHQNLAWLLLRVVRDFQDRAQASFRDRGHPGMQVAHAMVLVHLPLDGGRLTDLAAAAGVTKQSMGPLVDDMEQFGYVERVSDPDDRRAKRICFTEAGIALLEDSREVVARIWARYAETLGDRRLTTLRNSLAALLDGLEQPAETPQPSKEVRDAPL